MRKRSADPAAPAAPAGKVSFELGQLLITPRAQEAVPQQEVLIALRRHAAGDWGDTGPEDWQANELSLREGFRLLSVYHTRTGLAFWVITEADRASTTILLPSEY